MKKIIAWFPLAAILNIYCPTYYDNSKVVFNKTGKTVAVDMHAHMVDPTYRYPIVASYTVEPDSFNRLNYPGTSLRGISWQEDGNPQNYSYSVAGLDTQGTILLYPEGRIETRP